MIALYQNGERIMPGNGYPMRLLLPGYQGNMNVKYLRRIKLIDQPAMSFYEAKTYSQVLPGERFWRFHFLQEVKSFITHPSFGHSLKGPGYYEISGVAYSGNGRIARVMVSADGGKSWARGGAARRPAAAGLHPLPMPWRWDGQPVVLQSRAWDEAGHGAAAARRISSPRAARPRKPVTNPQRSPTSTTTASPAGASTTKGGSNMSTRKHPARSRRRAAPLRRRRGASPSRPDLGKNITEADITAWDIAVLPDGSNLPPGSGTAGARRPDLRAEMRDVPRRGRRASRGRATRRWSALQKFDRMDSPKTITYYEHATTLFDIIRRACRSCRRGR